MSWVRHELKLIHKRHMLPEQWEELDIAIYLEAQYQLARSYQLTYNDLTRAQWLIAIAIDTGIRLEREKIAPYDLSMCLGLRHLVRI